MSRPHKISCNWSRPPSVKLGTPPDKWDKCGELRININGLRQKQRDIHHKRREIELVITRESGEVKRLTKKLADQRARQFALNVVGLAASGGSANAISRAAGDAIGAITSVLGFTPLQRQLTFSLEHITSLSWDHKQLGSDLTYYETEIGKMYTTGKELGCVGF